MARSAGDPDEGRGPSVRAVQGNVSQPARSRVAPQLLIAIAGCLGCPQLLEDDFGALGLPLDPDAGSGQCIGPSCEDGGGVSTGGDAGSSPLGAGGVGGSDAGAGGEAGEGGASASGAGGASAGSGTADAASAEDPACWSVPLSADTHTAATNCLGIYGWNALEADPESSTSIDVSYREGKVCFEGSVANSGWGAVYSLTFANRNAWDANELGLTGFEFDVSGAALPAEVEFIYTSAGSDYCRVIAPAGTLSIPFTSTHPGCSTNPAASVPNTTTLTYLRWHFPVESAAYVVDFCLGIRAFQ
jgi:hypothetical protein